MAIHVIGSLVVLIGLGAFIHGLLNGIWRKKIRNRFLRDMPYATGPSAVMLGILTASAGLLFMSAGVFAILHNS